MKQHDSYVINHTSSINIYSWNAPFYNIWIYTSHLSDITSCCNKNNLTSCPICSKQFQKQFCEFVFLSWHIPLYLKIKETLCFISRLFGIAFNTILFEYQGFHLSQKSENKALVQPALFPYIVHYFWNVIIMHVFS